MAWETHTEWNLATNPRLTDPYGTIAVPDIRTNRASMPRPTSGNVWSALWGTGGAGTTAYIHQLIKATWTAAPTGAGRLIRANTQTGESVIHVTPDETITVSFDIASNRNARIALVVSLAEPIMLVLMGGVVLLIVMAILLPILGLNQLVN